MSERRTLQVAADEAGLRLDKFLVKHCPELGRRAAAAVIERGLVRVGGRRPSKAQPLAPGDEVELPLSWDFAPRPEPELALDVRLERADLVVVDKPAGQPTAPLGLDEPGTLAGALLARYPEMKGIGYRAREPGLLHRLDTRTSGLVVAARSALAFEALREALSEHRLDKRYLAIVEAQGLPERVSIELPLMPDPHSSGRVQVAPPGTSAGGVQPCTSHVFCLERHGRFALVEVEASRAYRHQVRVHLAARGWPIAGDLEYGGALRAALSGRHALHASRVAFAGDARVPAFTVESGLPADLRGFFEGGSELIRDEP